MAKHPTQIFLQNPQALRVEYRLDDCRLMLWWSPLAGVSSAAADRNYSNRDDHLDVFDRILIPGCDAGSFLKSDYDPYHTVLHFEKQTLHLAVRHDLPVLLVWCEKPQAIDFKTARHDQAECGDRSFVVRHPDGPRQFDFAAVLGAGDGVFRHSLIHAAENSRYTQACLSAGQLLVIGVSTAGDDTFSRCAAMAGMTHASHLAEIDGALAPHETAGRIVSPAHPDMETLRRLTVRGLHSMIDESAAFRASLKAIYYLIWVRDAAFAFNCQTAAGWPHKLAELCRLLLANPTIARGPDIPEGRMFAQLIHPDYGKYEEDGLYYVVWTAFTHWTRTGSREFFEGENLALLEEAIRWVERRAYDTGRGLFGGTFADETPAFGCRDYGWDFAIGMPSGDEHIQHDGKRVVRSHDIYLNTLMHTAYSMLGAACGGGYAEKAADLWRNLAPFYQDLSDGLPPYGELTCEDGSVSTARHWGPARSTYVWALALPNFLPLDGRDSMIAALLDAITEKPEMHWINGICAAVAAADPWFDDEKRLLDILLRIKDEAMKPGAYLPMGGAIAEKLGAPEGSLHDDIRPQGFAMAAWLAAWASLGVRSLPYGLAIRPTNAFTRLENYHYGESRIDFHFDPVAAPYAMEINGRSFSGTLQIPEGALIKGGNTVRLTTGSGGPLLLRSTARLLHVEASPGKLDFQIVCHGMTELTFADLPAGIELTGQDGPIVIERPDPGLIRFYATGPVCLLCPLAKPLRN
jgi:hypothetical protein